MSTRRSPIRRVARILLKVLAAVLTLVVVAVAAVLIVIHTDWGRAKIRAQVEAALADSVNGTAKVGRVEGSVFGELIARDIVIEDVDGRPVIQLDTVRIELALLDLVSQTAHIERLTIQGGQVIALAPVPGDPGEDEVRLRSVADVFQKDEPSEPSPWAVKIDDLKVAGLSILWSDGRQENRIEELAGGARLAVERRGGGVTATVDLRGRWRERGSWVTLQADAATDEEEVRVGSALVALDLATLTMKDVVIRGQAITGSVVADVPAGAWTKLWPEGPMIGAVHLETTARPGATPTTLDVTFGGKLAGATLAGQLAYDQATRRARGHITTTDVDASAIVRTADPTAIDAHLAIDGGVTPGATELTAAGFDGGAFLRVAGTAAGVQVDEVVMTVGAHGGWFAVAAGAIGPGHATVRASAYAQITPASIELAASRLVANVPQVQAIAPDLKARGAVTADLRASGRLGATRRLDVAGFVRGKALGTEGFTARTAAVDLDARDLLGRPAGRVRAELDGVYLAGDYMGRVRVDARTLERGKVAVNVVSWPPMAKWRVDVNAVAEVALPRVDVALGTWKLRTREVDWIGRGGTIALDEHRVTVRGLKANLEGGALAAAATFYRVDGERRRAGDVDVTARIAGTDLAAFDRAFDLGGAVGRADVDVSLERRGAALHGSADLALRGVGRFPGAPSLDLATSVTFSPRRITVDGTLKAELAGSATFGIDVVPPRRMTDGRAWQHLDRRALTAEVIIPKLDLAQLQLIAGIADPTVTGSLEGRMTLTPTTTKGSLIARGVRTPDLPEGADLTLTIAPTGDKLAIAADAQIKTVGNLALKATVAVPTRPLDLAAWARVDQRAIAGVTVRADDLAIAGLTKLAGMPPGWTGRGTVAVDIAAGLRDARVAVGGYGLRGGPLAQPLDLDAIMFSDGKTVAAALTTRLGGLRALTAKATLDVSVEALRRAGGAAVQTAPLAVTVSMENVAIAPLLHVAGRNDRLAGTANLTATVTGTLADPVAKARWSLTRLRSDRRDLGTLEGDVDFNGELLAATVRGRQKGGGTLKVAARYPLAAPNSATATVNAKGFDLVALAAFAPEGIRDVRGKLDADVEVRGADPATLAVAAVMRLREGELPVAPVLGTLRDATVDLSIRQRAVTIRADGRIGDGRAKLAGTATLAGVLPDTAEFEVAVDDVILLNELQPTIDAKVKAVLRRTGGAGGPWKADVVVSGTRVVIPAEKGRDLDPVGAPNDVYFIGDKRKEPSEPIKVPRPGPDQPLAEPFLITTVQIKPVEIRSAEVRASVSGKLTASIGVDALRVTGGVEAPRGVLTLFNRRYLVERASVRFDGPPDPRLDVRLTHEFAEMTIYVEVAGRASAPVVTLRSDPSTYSQGELLGILLGGEPGQAPKTAGEATTGVASSFVAGKVIDYLGDYLPIDFDVLTIEGPTSGSGAGASFTVGKWLSRAMFVAYRQRVTAAPDQNAGEAELEYWLRPRLVVEGIVGDRGIHGLDLLYTRRW